MDFAHLKTRLLKLDVSHVCDADKYLRVLDPALRPLRAGLKFAGRAHTVTCREDFLTVIKALHDAQAGDVLVVDAQGGRRAMAGELFATEAARKGLAAIVIDGACRDSATLKRLEIPVYARAVTPMAGTAARLFETQIPVTCGGVVVHPGDILFGDDDGVVVGTPAEIEAALPQAEAIRSAEEKVAARLAQGASLSDLLNYAEHLGRIQAGEESQLKFEV